MRMLDRLFGRHGQDTSDELQEGYCFGCKSRRRIKDPVQLRMKNGRSRIQGSCETCGVNMSKLGKLASPASPKGRGASTLPITEEPSFL